MDTFMLRAAFQQYGTILSTKIQLDSGLGFVQYETQEEAEAAIAAMHGIFLHGQDITVTRFKSAKGGAT